MMVRIARRSLFDMRYSARFSQKAPVKIKKIDSDSIVSFKKKKKFDSTRLEKIPLKPSLNSVHWRSSMQDLANTHSKFSQYMDEVQSQIKHLSTPRRSKNSTSRNKFKSNNTQRTQNFDNDVKFRFQTAVSQFNNTPKNKPMTVRNQTKKAPGFVISLAPNSITRRSNVKSVSISTSQNVSPSNTNENVKKMFSNMNYITPQMPRRKDLTERVQETIFPECNYFENRMRNKKKRIRKILSNIRSDLKYRRNVDIEQFLELRNSSSEVLEPKNESKKVELTQEQIAFGIEILPDGSKQFKMYDKVLLSFTNPFDICLIPPEDRTPNDNLYLAHYLLQNVKYISVMNLTLIAFISRKITAQRYCMSQKIIIKGEIGDCMYILYKGIVEVIIEGRKGEPILMESGSVFGETALQNDVTRTATIVARSDVEVMILSKKDYLNVVYESKNLERSNNLIFLLGLKFFKGWTGPKIEEINKTFGILELKPHQVVYRAGDYANVFYIVRAGVLHMESVVEVENTYRYPVGPKKWEYKKITRRLSYRVKELKRGDMFGHEEIFDQVGRRAIITSLEESELMYMNLPEFNRLFNKQFIKEKLFLEFPRIDLEKAKEMLLKNDITRRKNSEAIFKAINVNYSSAISREIFPEDRKIKKLRFILEKAKRKQCFSKEEKEEHDKIKVLSVRSSIS
ncbi:unnamed protein product [Moneuplotes crassus]|uniref:Cyclic nucleotide-binding domain-containing protein n=1 Tax=Euplotes crassus TaxID=5936 RepID=A0AAD1UEL2_EUPCR|nr:unnamed protein product [Moneuplotes crassus]